MEPNNTRATKKKRARSPSLEENPNGQKRGRPRAEKQKQDESTTDRRRTQIRMAQRAYRQRKESTLDDLRKRVAEMSNTAELMSKAVNDCFERLIPGLTEQQAHDFQETVSYCGELVRSTLNTGDNDSPALPLVQHDQPPVAEHGAPAILSANHATPAWIAQTTKTHLPSAAQQSYLGMGYFSVDTSGEVGEATPWLTPQSLSQTSLQGPSGTLLAARMLDTVTQLPAEIPPAQTYSSNETSFARRLHRASLEGAYQLLLDPTKQPRSYERVFKLSLMARDRPKLIGVIESCLAKGPTEDLDVWQAPLLHVGGAGTHYPRKDRFGNRLPKKETFHLGLVGPQTLALLENAAQDNLTADMTVEIAGFEGTWLDPYDVEGYLEEKGIYLAPQASFAKADMVGWPMASYDSSTGSSATMPQTPPEYFSTDTVAAPFNVEQIEVLDRIGADPNQWDGLARVDFTGAGLSRQMSGPPSGSLMTGEGRTQTDMTIPQTSAGSWPAVGSGNASSHSTPNFKDNSRSLQPRGKSVIVDVAKFTTALAVTGVCLGRVPGFKRRDIDRALAMSSFDSF